MLPMCAEDQVQKEFLLGDEAVARAAIDAGVTGGFAYPGTPSTEAFEYLERQAAGGARLRASWCANEKVAVESALGVSMVGRRSVAIMKHVGLNVAADPFVNAALVAIRGGLVVVVADDPGMHSSQNEQDSRFYGDFARVLCLEPSCHQEAYDMTREAFALSERFRIPVLLRLVTRLAHARGSLEPGPPEAPHPLSGDPDRDDWILLPANARRRWASLLRRQRELNAWSEGCRWQRLEPGEPGETLGVVTTGVAATYFAENLADMPRRPWHLHIGAYPVPVARIRTLVESCTRVLVLEEGYPFVERMLRGLLPADLPIAGKMSGEVPPSGELGPECVREALGLIPRPPSRPPLELPSRPPQLCNGCPHRDSFAALGEALAGREGAVVTGDIGCYTLAALPPYRAMESCVCMGASIGMGRGAALAGSRPVVAVIGDSTFVHSGIPPLLDAIAEDTDMTVLVLDNAAVGMTGAQDPRVPSSRLHDLALGLGVPAEHCHVVEAHPRRIAVLADVMRREIDHRGLSVVIAVRECVEHARRRKARARRAEVTAE